MSPLRPVDIRTTEGVALTSNCDKFNGLKVLGPRGFLVLSAWGNPRLEPALRPVCLMSGSTTEGTATLENFDVVRT